MKKYVKVKFNIYGKSYVYKIPERINPQNIQNYVVVENANYNKKQDISPYKIVKVVELLEENSVNENNYNEMKYIVDIIDGDSYFIERQNLKLKQKHKKTIEGFFSSLSYEDQIAILLNSMSYESVTELLYGRKGE